MKNFKNLFTLILLFNVLSQNAFDFWPFDFGKKTKESPKIIIPSGLAEKQHQLNVLKKEKEAIESKSKEFLEPLQNELNEVNKRISDIKEKLKDKSNQDYLNKILAKLNEIAQILIDTQIFYKKFLSSIDLQIELLENYIKDPLFKEKTIELKASYGFENLQKLNKDLFVTQQELSTLSEEKINLESNLEALKKEYSIVEKELKQKEKEQKRFSAKPKNDINGEDELIIRQKGEFLDFEIRLLAQKKKLLDIKTKEFNQRLSLINTQIFLLESILKIIKDDLLTVERGLWVSENDIEKLRKNLADKNIESTELQAKYSQEISQLSQEKEKLQEEFEKIIKQNAIHLDLKSLNDWSIHPNGISEPIIYELGYLNDKILTIDREISLKESQKELEKKRLQFEEVLFNIINSWYKISQRKFKKEEEINFEKKKYEELKLEANKELTAYKDKINLITNLLNNQSKVINNIKDKIKLINQKQERFSLKYGIFQPLREYQ